MGRAGIAALPRWVDMEEMMRVKVMIENFEITMEERCIPTLKTSIEYALKEAVTQEYLSASGRRFGLNAFKRGFMDGANGRMTNPYPDVKTWDGKVTYSRAYRRKWESGYQAWRKFERNYAA